MKTEKHMSFVSKAEKAAEYLKSLAGMKKNAGKHKNTAQGCAEKEMRQSEPPQTAAVLEAVLFAAGGAVELEALAKACGCDRKTARGAMRELIARYEAADGGLLIREYEGSYEMCTNPRCYASLIRLLAAPKKPVLTGVLMETLSIIAFRSPATKVEIERIRGVKSDHAVNRLIEYGLVEEVGRLDVPGRPALFAPTDAFYRRFGVSGKDGLPNPGPETQAEIQKEVAQALSVYSGEPEAGRTESLTEEAVKEASESAVQSGEKLPAAEPVGGDRGAETEQERKTTE